MRLCCKPDLFGEIDPTKPLNEAGYRFLNGSGIKSRLFEGPKIFFCPLNGIRRQPCAILGPKKLRAPRKGQSFDSGVLQALQSFDSAVLQAPWSFDSAVSQAPRSHLKPLPINSVKKGKNSRRIAVAVALMGPKGAVL